MRATRRRRLRSHKLLAAVIAAVVVAALGGSADLGYVVLKAKADDLQAHLTFYLQAGQRELESGKSTLQQANANHDVTLAMDAQIWFNAARAQFVAASQLADNSQLLQWLERTPGVSDLTRSRHTAVDGVAAMGVGISDAGSALAELDGRLIEPPSSGQAGRSLLTVLAEAQTSLEKIKVDFAHARDSAAHVDVRVLPPLQQSTFLKARTTIDSALAGIDEFERLVPVMTEVLGGNGVRTYLVEQVNPAELRPGGGFIGTYSLIRADHGSLSVIRSGDAYTLVNPRPLPGQPGFIPQPTPYREIIPNTSWSFVDSNIYPDFPTNATTAEKFVQPRIGKVDGVIAMDYYTVAKMLDLTGPMAGAGFGTITGANFVPKIIAADIRGGIDYKSILAAVAGPLMQRVAGLSADHWPQLISALNGLASSRHLQLYFNNSSVEGELGRVGWSGILRPTGAADFMMEVEANYWGNKVNYFLTRRYTIALNRTGTTLHHVVTIDLSNATVCGSYDRTSYRADFRLFVGDTASAVSSDLRAVRYANPPPPAGTRAADGWVWDVSCGGGRGRATFTYDTPWPLPDKIAQVYWQKQPGTTADTVAVTWNDGKGHTYASSGDLGQDRVITLTSSGVTLTAAQPAQATLPSLSLG